MKKQITVALKILAVMILLTGVSYPLIMTALAQLTFPKKANGSLIWKNGEIAGSYLIGQKFDSSAYFWPRPSAVDYNPLPSGGSNLGPTSEKLEKLVAERSASFISLNYIQKPASVPKEMLFASASGLDPHISPESARMQLERVAQSRGFTDNEKQQLLQLILSKSEKPQFFLLGESRINVFELNLSLDNIR
jgi:K+-transporting ATPase ATPase C chain